MPENRRLSCGAGTNSQVSLLHKSVFCLPHRVRMRLPPQGVPPEMSSASSVHRGNKQLLEARPHLCLVSGKRGWEGRESSSPLCEAVDVETPDRGPSHHILFSCVAYRLSPSLTNSRTVPGAGAGPCPPVPPPSWAWVSPGMEG